jgi:hypothetical protein
MSTLFARESPCLRPISLERGKKRNFYDKITRMIIRLICAKYLNGECSDEDVETCEHRRVHRPSVVCNDPLIVCDDGSPTRCIPVLDAENIE